ESGAVARRRGLEPLAHGRDRRLERALRIGMASDGGVAEHRLGTRRRDDHPLRLAGLRVDDRIAKMPEAPVDGDVLDLVIRDGRLQVAIPIDETVAAIDQPIAKHIEESPSHRARADRIHGEALAIPVASAAHHLLLANDPGLVLVLPLPDPLDEPFTTEVV